MPQRATSQWVSLVCSNEEQVVAVTGASSGIGLATTRLAIQCGARVMLAARDEESLRRAVADLEDRGGDAAYVVVDVSDPDDVRQLADATIDRFGRFDSWVAISGRMAEVPLEEATLPPPVYDAEVVARAIVDCCETPHGEVNVGGGSTMIQALNVVPGPAFRYMEWSIFRGQKQSPREASSGHAGDSLYQPSAPGAQKHGDLGGRTRGTSAFTQARLHTLRTVGIVVAVGATVAAVTRAVRS